MSKSLARRLGATLLASVCLLGSALAQTGKPLKLIVPFPAGGTADILPRILAEKMRANFPAGVVVENRAGAGGNIGAEVVFRADPDGTTLLASPPGPIAINHNLYNKLAFDPTRWTPITVIATIPNVLSISTKLPVKNLAEFIAYVKANPGKVSYASQGNGSTSHLTGQMFATMIGGDMVHVPFKGEGPALTELLGGRIDLFFGNISAVLKYRETNQVKLLGLASARRGSMATDVPSAVEGGLPDFVASAWFAVAAPPGTPPAIVTRLNTAINDAMKLPDVKEKFAAQGAEVVGGSPADMSAFVSGERVRWKKVIDSANVKLD